MGGNYLNSINKSQLVNREGTNGAIPTPMQNSVGISYHAFTNLLEPLSHNIQLQVKIVIIACGNSCVEFADIVSDENIRSLVSQTNPLDSVYN